MPESSPSEPDAPANSPDAPPDGSLGGYFDTHNRPPAYEGSDGHPYTVSLEVERTGNLRAPWSAFLVFPRWAQTGVGIVGHAETDTLGECGSAEEAHDLLRGLSLFEVQDLLETTIRRSSSHPHE